MKKLVYLVVLSSFSIVSNSQSAKEYYKAAKQLIEVGNCNQAIEQLDKAIAINKLYVDALESRATCLEKSGKIIDAANDWAVLSDNDISQQVYHVKAANLYVQAKEYEKATNYFKKITDANKKTVDILYQKIENHSRLGQFEKALIDCDKIVNFKWSAKAFFIKAQITDSLRDYGSAEREFLNCIGEDPNYPEAYLGLAGTRVKLKKYEEALSACNQAIQLFARYAPAYYMKSQINFTLKNYTQAISDLNYALSLDNSNINYYLLRAQVYTEDNQLNKAIEDYNTVIKMDPRHYLSIFYRAQVFEKINFNNEAKSDYEQVLKLLAEGIKNQPVEDFSKNRLHELYRETNKPTLSISTPQLIENKYIRITGNTDTIQLKGVITDQSMLSYLKINNKEVATTKTAEGFVFETQIVLDSAKQLFVNIADVYDNVSKNIFMLERSEITPPKMSLVSPYESDNGEIFLQSNDANLYIEGRVQDESYIKSIMIDGVSASYSISDKNPSFMATINISNKDKISVTVVDIYDNTLTKEYKFNRESANILTTNPMGKTWVIFIENSNYQSFASLDGPQKDISLIRSALNNYQVHNILHKKNMTKEQLEKFFAIDLRDLVKLNNINSILVWYAGHGKFINETGYWIPVDARRDDEFSYFNINNLKASLQSYTSYITHTLVITDACESGPSFYQAMRATDEERNCDNYEATKFKSSQVFSSAGYELASDNSQFSKTFANALKNNPSTCIPIEKIVNQVKVAVKNSGAKQEPKFGKIAGLVDENGTFFFMAK